MKVRSMFKVQGSMFSVILGCSLFALTASAEQLLLRNGIVHTVTGATLNPGDVLIENGKIKEVSAHIESSASAIDLKGQHLYPGMIALDTSLGLTELSGVRSTLDEREVGDFVPDVKSWVAVNPDSELLPVARANGVTHIEPAPQGNIAAGQSGLVVLDGWTSEQMAYKKPIALHVYWPDMDLDLTPKEKVKDKAKWKSPEDQAKERTNKLKALDDFFQDARAYTVARDVAKTNAAVDPGRNPSWEAMRPFVRAELPITVHADDVREIKAAVKWADTNHFKIIIAGGRDSWMTADLLAQKNIPVIWEHTYQQPAHDYESYESHYAAPEKLRKAGVKVIFSLGGSTFIASLIKNLPYEAAQAVAFGLPEDEAIKGVTLYPAQAAGVADKLGSIEPGKDATLFACDGSILDLRAKVHHVWIAGKEMSLESRHTRLYNKYKKRP
ncbi:MAG: Amidohydrolase [Verrucomicrobiales bacterium]|nr:Amidohydrolase [Verrucomicrobiales bacterium]